jgi:hypothetical protein
VSLIISTWEAEIKRTMFGSQPGQDADETPISTITGNGVRLSFQAVWEVESKSIGIPG